MAVRIRLKRTGRKNRPFYRVVAVDRRRPRDSKVLEELGYYDPINKDLEKQVSLVSDRIKYWLGVGAQPSETVHSILRRNGVVAGPFRQLTAKA